MSRARLFGRGANRLRHQGHDVRLGNRLAVADRQGHVRVSDLLEVLRHEPMTGEAAHDLQHLRIRDVPAAKLLLDHAFPRLDVTRIFSCFGGRLGSGR